jgi:uncharacterized protein YndB with AHSA1/START domain
VAESSFVYVTYIRTSPTKLWAALLQPEFTRQFWLGATLESDWKPGSPWKLRFADGRTGDVGEVIEAKPPSRLVLSWRHEHMPDLKAEGFSTMTFDIHQHQELCKLTVTHQIDAPRSKLIGAVSNGWPLVLSGLKSLLETGSPLPGADTFPRADCPGST